jgi:hypothetical protein
MQIARRHLQLLGTAFLGLAAALGLLAVAHMRSLAAYGYVCGGAVPHCPACPASLAALAAGTGLLAWAARAPRRRRVRIDR